MTIQPREYHRPADWNSALAALDQPGASACPLFIAPRVPAEPYAGVDSVVDLSRLGLANIKLSDEAVELGALVPLQDLVEAPWQNDAALGLLSQAARLAGHPGLRHLATVGGVLSARSGPPEVLLALLAFDATALLHGAGATERALPLADFLSLDGTPPGEIVSGVKFARPGAYSAGALERVARTPRDEAIVAAAALLVVEAGVCRKARLTIAGAGVAPLRAPAAEALLEGQTLSAELIARAAELAAAGLMFASDLRGSAAYRQAMAVIVARRSLMSAWGKLS